MKRELPVKRSLIAAMMAAALVACGGGGGGRTSGDSPDPGTQVPPPGPDEVVALTVASFLPAMASGVSRTTEISATFSQPLLASTVTPANLRFTHQGAAVPGTLSYDAAQSKVKFVPQQAALDVLANYTVTAGTGLQDTAGRSLEAERSWTFRTADGHWQGPRQLEAASGNAMYQDVAVDREGNATATWIAADGAGVYQFRAAHYTPTGGWGGAYTVNVQNGLAVRNLSFRLDGQGNGLAIWMQLAAPMSIATQLWSARYVKGQGWEAPVLVDTHDDGTARAVSLAVSAAGEAFAVWTWPIDAGGFSQEDDVWAARFSAASGWEAPVHLGTTGPRWPNLKRGQPPRVMVDTAGNAYVLWIEIGTSDPVWFARYAAGSGWQPPAALAGVPAGEPGAPALAVSGDGQVLALWTLRNGNNAIWSSLLASPAGNWSTPALLDGVGESYPLRAVADGAGAFHLMWERHTLAGCTESSVHYGKYVPGTGWGTTATVSAAQACAEQGNGSMALDRNGNLMVLWGVRSQGVAGGNSQESVLARRYDAAAGWQPVQTVFAPQDGMGAIASVAAWPDGTLAAIWTTWAMGQPSGAAWVSTLK